MKNLILIFLVFIGFISAAQNNSKKDYYVNMSGKRVYCSNLKANTDSTLSLQASNQFGEYETSIKLDKVAYYSIDGITTFNIDPMLLVGESLTQSGQHKNNALLLGASGLALNLIISVSFTFGGEPIAGAILGGVTAIVFGVAAIVQTVKANNELKKAGDLLQETVNTKDKGNK